MAAAAYQLDFKAHQTIGAFQREVIFKPDTWEITHGQWVPIPASQKVA